jgi:hypothetical protein
MIINLDDYRDVWNPVDTKADITVIDSHLVAIKLCGGVTIYVGGRVDGSTFAQRDLPGGEFEEIYFPPNMSLADMIRVAVEWGMPF